MTRASMGYLLVPQSDHSSLGAAPSRNTAEPALPGRWCCPLQGGGRLHEVSQPGGVLKTRRDAAVDVEDVAIDEARCVAREEHRRADQVFDVAPAPRRRAADEPGAEVRVLDQRIVQFG